MTQTFIRQDNGPVCKFLLGYFLPLYVLDVEELTSKIQFEPEVLELRGYSSFSLVEFYITYIYVFEVFEVNRW